MSERYTFIDHDGTLTDSVAEMTDYRELVLNFNQRMLGLSEVEINSLMQEAEAIILGSPEKYGWEIETEFGKIITAPATSYQYLYYQAVTRLLLEKMHRKIGHSMLEKHGGINQYLDTMFQQSYPLLSVHYRDDAVDFLNHVQVHQQPDRWAIVTNSNPTKVAQKLTALGLNFEPRIIRDAQKYMVNRAWTGLLPQGPIQIQGFPKRGVEMQRQFFYQKLLETTKGEISNVQFVEDIAEFILWLDWLAQNNPEYAGVRTALVLSQITPAWERKYYTDGNSRRFGSESLMSIAQRLDDN